jgi:hypothetical protein
MAYQLEVVRLRDMLPVQEISRIVPGVTPTMLEFKGYDFSSAERVLINESPSPEIMIVNKQTLWAQLPAYVRKVSTIEVLSSNFTKSKEPSRMSFEIGNKTKKVNGIMKLVQLFTKWVLQSPGSDIFDPSRGGGLQEIAGKINTTRNMQPVMTSIARSVSTTASQIRAAQQKAIELPLSERLLSATVNELNVYEAQMLAAVRVKIESFAGTEATAALEL